MRFIPTTAVTVACLCTTLLLDTPALAALNQSVDKNATIRPTTAVKSKTTETKPASTKPVSTTTVVTAANKKEQKDRPGKRFWGRIMDHFREIHSADKKMQ